MESSPVKIGLLGCGTVGAALAQLVVEQHDVVARRTGLDLSVAAVVVRDISKDRQVPVPDEAFSTDPATVVGNPNIDVVVEVMGGLEPARQMILDALAAGQPVITANKELLAAHGPELYAAAEVAGVDLLFEAAVAGAIPIMRPLRESLAGEPVTRVMGIINGTTNFILSRMTDDGASFADALAEAQDLGYAEADPTADVEGYDAGAKVAVIATLAFGARVSSADVHHEGITGVTTEDIAFASRLGHCIKLLAIADRRTNAAGQEEIGVRVHPALVPQSHPLAAVNGSFNAVFVEGDAVGQLMFYGPGAGGRPTASAVFGDLIDAAGNHQRSHGARIGDLQEARIASLDDLCSAFYLNLEVADQPGVLSQVADVFGQHGVSIQSMEQEGLGNEARLIFITHQTREADLRATLGGLNNLAAVRCVGSVLRVIGE